MTRSKKIKFLTALVAVGFIATGCSSPSGLSGTASQSSGYLSAELEATVGYYCLPNLCHLIVENVSDRPVSVSGDLCGRIGNSVYQGVDSVSTTLNPGARGQIDFSFLGSYPDGRLSKIWLGSCSNESSPALVWLNPENKLAKTESGTSSSGSTNTNPRNESAQVAPEEANPSEDAYSKASGGYYDEPEKDETPQFSSIFPEWLGSTEIQIESFSIDGCSSGTYPSAQFCGKLTLRLENLDELSEHRFSVSGRMQSEGQNPYFEFIFEPGQESAETSVYVSDWLSKDGDIVEADWTEWAVLTRHSSVINYERVEIQGAAKVGFDFDPVEYFIVANQNSIEDRFALQAMLEENGLCLTGRNVFLLGTGQYELFRCSGSNIYPYDFSTSGSVKVASTLSKTRGELGADFCLYGQGWHSCSDLQTEDEVDLLGLINQLEIPWVWARYSSEECSEDGCWIQRQNG